MAVVAAVSKQLPQETITILNFALQTQPQADLTYDFATAVTRAPFVGLIYCTVSEAVELNDAVKRRARVQYGREVLPGPEGGRDQFPPPPWLHPSWQCGPPAYPLVVSRRAITGRYVSN